jgi:hypothetical protein
MRQGELPKGYDVTQPAQGPSWPEWLTKLARLPPIGRETKCLDAWRDIDAMQSLQSTKEGHNEY